MSDDTTAVPDEGLDGHTMQELGEYLDRGRLPVDPSIENSAACRLALASMTKLSEISADALRRSATTDPHRDDAWIVGLLDTIRSEIQPGREIPILNPDPVIRLALTEASVRGLVRRAGDTLGGVIMGRCTLEGDVETPGELIRLEVTCALEYGVTAGPLLERLRSRIRDSLTRHTELLVGDIDITVDDVLPPHGGER